MEQNTNVVAGFVYRENVLSIFGGNIMHKYRVYIYSNKYYDGIWYKCLNMTRVGNYLVYMVQGLL